MVDKHDKSIRWWDEHPTGRISSEPELQVLPIPDHIVKLSELIEKAKTEVGLVVGIDFGSLEAAVIMAAARSGKTIILDSHPPINEIRGRNVDFAIFDDMIEPTEIMPFVPAKTRGGQVRDPKPHHHLIQQASLSPKRRRRK